MKFREYYYSRDPVISFELFPPKTDAGFAKLEDRLPKLIRLEPAFITVTYGAMGETQARTLEIASKIRNGYGKETAHHLTCVGANKDEIDQSLEAIQEHGIQNIVALRGDPPKGETEFKPAESGYSYAAQLVAHIRRKWDFGIAVAGYPEKHLEAPDFDSDLLNLKHKVEAGADLVITQLFYDNSCYYEFVERCRSLGIEVPIVPGLMPILNVKQIQRITTMCGSTIPDSLRVELENAQNEEAVYEVGIRHTAAQAIDLIQNGVPGIHFYVLNRYFHIAEVMARIRPYLSRRDAASG